MGVRGRPACTDADQPRHDQPPVWASADRSRARAFFQSRAERVERIRTSEDVIVSKVGRELYEKFFRTYTRKQWGLDPSELDASVTSRVPVRTNRDDRYFTDTYQAMPLHGYTRMFERMIAHPNIKVMLNTSYLDLHNAIPLRRDYFTTGPIDEYFDFRYGKLQYRSIFVSSLPPTTGPYSSRRRSSTIRSIMRTRGAPSLNT